MDQTPTFAAQQALRYDGRVGQLHAIFVSLLLTVVTLGICRFWAITRWRRHLWSHMSTQGERLEYTGHGTIIGLWMAPLFEHLSDPRAAVAMQRALPFIVLGVIAFRVGVSVLGCWYWAIFTRHVIGHT